MKKLMLLLIVSTTALFYSCKKDGPPPPPRTWIIGKWKMTDGYNDTVVNRNRRVMDYNIMPNAFVFIDDHTGKDFNSNSDFQYSLNTMTLTDSGGSIFNIKQVSYNEMTLTNYKSELLWIFKKIQ